MGSTYSKPDFSGAIPILLLHPFKKGLRLWWRGKPRAGWYAVTGFYLCIYLVIGSTREGIRDLQAVAVGCPKCLHGEVIPGAFGGAALNHIPADNVTERCPYEDV